MSWTYNPDVLGYMVRLSSFIINICAGILIRWGSTKNAQDAIRNMLFQIGAIVLCTLISIVRDQLSFFDGLFTLTVAHSPIAWYILWINGCSLYFWIRRRHKVIPANPVLCLALVCGWISLHLVVWFKGRKFPHDNCGSMSFKVYMQSVALQLVPTLLTGLPATALIPISWGSYIILYLRYYCGGKRLAIPLVQIDSTASGGNTLSAAGQSSSGPAAVAYLDVPIPSSEMDITTTPLSLHEGEVHPPHAPSPGEEGTLPSVPRSASPLQSPTSEPVNTLLSVNSEHI
ncbi:hypothetical protein B0H13DRAFT_2455968 [Mycena leptocephala]|nr:hypothetical protein B0H13DRAFT_2455968 [Mycena leptocephala]